MYECLSLKYDNGCTTVNPGASYSVNDLPGVSVRKIANVTDEDNVNSVNMFNKLLRAARSTVANDITSALAKHINLHTYDLTENRSCQKLGTTTTDDAFIKISFDDFKDPFTSQKVSSISFFSAENKQVSISVTDVSGYSDIITHTAVQGLNKLIINKTFNTDGEIRFSGITRYECLPMSCNCKSYQISANIGFQLYTIHNIEDIICQFADVINYALYWQWGVKLMWEILNSDRINFVVDYSKDQARENIATWTAKDGEYTKAIDNAVTLIREAFRQSAGYSTSCNIALIQTV